MDKLDRSILSILQEKLRDIQFKFNKSFCGHNIDVLIENQSISNPKYFFGRTPFMQSVYINAQKIRPGEVKNVNISTCNHKNLYASC